MNINRDNLHYWLKYADALFMQDIRDFLTDEIKPLVNGDSYERQEAADLMHILANTKLPQYSTGAIIQQIINILG